LASAILRHLRWYFYIDHNDYPEWQWGYPDAFLILTSIAEILVWTGLYNLVLVKNSMSIKLPAFIILFITLVSYIVYLCLTPTNGLRYIMVAIISIKSISDFYVEFCSA